MQQFEQAAIKVQQENEFQDLKAAVDVAFRPDQIQRFLRSLARRRVRIRDFDAVVERGILEKLDRALRASGTAKILYGRLALSDQAQIKEFYLCKVEEVGPELRAKFHKLYQYY